MSESKPSHLYFVRGGARIGWVNYSWPLASLSVDRSNLTIATTLFGLVEMGRYRFAPDQVIRIEKLDSKPWGAAGIRIHHTVAGYPEKIVFWCSPSVVSSGIASTGFPMASGGAAVAGVSPGRGFPFQIWPLALGFVIWNMLLAYDFLLRSHVGPCTVAMLISASCTSAALLRFPAMQKVLLRPGRGIDEIRPVLLLLAIITGLMAVVFTTISLIGGASVATRAAFFGR